MKKTSIIQIGLSSVCVLALAATSAAAAAGTPERVKAALGNAPMTFGASYDDGAFHVIENLEVTLEKGVLKAPMAVISDDDVAPLGFSLTDLSIVRTGASGSLAADALKGSDLRAVAALLSSDVIPACGVLEGDVETMMDGEMSASNLVMTADRGTMPEGVGQIERTTIAEARVSYRSNGTFTCATSGSVTAKDMVSNGFDSTRGKVAEATISLTPADGAPRGVNLSGISVASAAGLPVMSLDDMTIFLSEDAVLNAGVPFPPTRTAIDMAFNSEAAAAQFGGQGSAGFSLKGLSIDAAQLISGDFMPGFKLPGDSYPIAGDVQFQLTVQGEDYGLAGKFDMAGLTSTSFDVIAEVPESAKTDPSMMGTAGAVKIKFATLYTADRGLNEIVTLNTGMGIGQLLEMAIFTQASRIPEMFRPQITKISADALVWLKQAMAVGGRVTLAPQRPMNLMEIGTPIMMGAGGLENSIGLTTSTE